MPVHGPRLTGLGEKILATGAYGDGRIDRHVDAGDMVGIERHYCPHTVSFDSILLCIYGSLHI